MRDKNTLIIYFNLGDESKLWKNSITLFPRRSAHWSVNIRPSSQIRITLLRLLFPKVSGVSPDPCFFLSSEMETKLFLDLRGKVLEVSASNFRNLFFSSSASGRDFRDFIVPSSEFYFSTRFFFPSDFLRRKLFVTRHASFEIRRD